MNTKALVTMTASIIAANAVLADDFEEDTRLSAYVKLGERGAYGKLISWDSIPSGVNFVSASGEKERSFLVTDRGLSLSTGFMVIFR